MIKEQLPILTAHVGEMLVIDKGAAMFSFQNGGIPTHRVHVSVTYIKKDANGKILIDRTDPKNIHAVKETISDAITDLTVTYTPEEAKQ
jgi:hypothetical protein